MYLFSCHPRFFFISLKAFNVPPYSCYICLCCLHHACFVPLQYQFNLPLFSLYLLLYRQTLNLLTLTSFSLSVLLITPFNIFTASFIPPSVMIFLYHAHTFSLQCHSFYLCVTNSPLFIRYLRHLTREIRPLLFPL